MHLLRYALVCPELLSLCESACDNSSTSLLTCRALKTKHDTPKYGLIYHASLVGQTAPKNKGKISRMLAAKASLCVRVDALGEDDDRGLGLASRAMVEERVRQCEQEQLRRISGTGKARAQAEKYQPKRWEWHRVYIHARDSLYPQ